MSDDGSGPIATLCSVSLSYKAAVRIKSNVTLSGTPLADREVVLFFFISARVNAARISFSNQIKQHIDFRTSKQRNEVKTSREMKGGRCLLPGPFAHVRCGLGLFFVLLFCFCFFVFAVFLDSAEHEFVYFSFPSLTTPNTRTQTQLVG